MSSVDVAAMASGAGGLAMLTPGGMAIGVGLAIAGTVGSMFEQNKALKFQKQAAMETQQLRMAQAYNASVQNVRQRLVANANLVNTAASTGTLGSSGMMGAASSIAAQTGSAQGFMGFTSVLSNDIARNQQAAQTRMGNARAYSDTASAGIQTIGFLHQAGYM